MTLEELNQLPEQEYSRALFNCCGSTSWIKKMLQSRPFASKADLKEKAVELFGNCKEEDWLEAFSHHPKLGDKNKLQEKFTNTSQWAEEEQAGTAEASDDVLAQLEQANIDYENKFGFIYLLCATGKSASFMLDTLRLRLVNDGKKELHIAMEEQNKITKLRLEKLLS